MGDFRIQEVEAKLASIKSKSFEKQPASSSVSRGSLTEVTKLALTCSIEGKSKQFENNTQRPAKTTNDHSQVINIFIIF